MNAFRVEARDSFITTVGVRWSLDSGWTPCRVLNVALGRVELAGLSFVTFFFHVNDLDCGFVIKSTVVYLN